MIPTNRQQPYQELVELVAQHPDYYGAIREIFPFLEDVTLPLPELSDECLQRVYERIFPFLGQPSEWGAYDEHIMEFVQNCWATNNNLISSYNYSCSRSDLWTYWAKSILMDKQDEWTFQKTLSLLKKYGLEESLIWSKAIEEASILLKKESKYQLSETGYDKTNTDYVKIKRNAAEIEAWMDKEVSAVGVWVLERSKAYVDGKKRYLGNTYQYSGYHNLLILTGQLDLIKNNFDTFCTVQSGWRTEIDNMHLLDTLLAHGVMSIEEKILDFREKTESSQQLITLNSYLNHYFPEKYNSKELEFAYHYLNALTKKQSNYSYSFDFVHTGEYSADPYYNLYINRLIHLIFEKEGFEKAYPFWQAYLAAMPITTIEIYKYLVDLLGEKALPLLMEALAKPLSKVYYAINVHRGIFELLPTLPHEKYYPELWKNAAHKSKEVRTLVARHFATVLGDGAIPKAKELLAEKKADARLTGALLLSMIRSEQALAVLTNALETEKNDDTRDTILEALTGFIPSEMAKEAVLEKIQYAAQRGKLSTSIEKWLDESTLPSLHWKDNGEVMDIQVVRFMFYRMSRVKDIRFDVEVKPLFAWIDKETSANFANTLLKSYLKNSADAKGKYILTIAAVLGDNDTVDILKRQVVEWTENARGKMGEYATKAIALQGSNKALRTVEFFTRKFKNKNKNIGEAANQAFVIAAEELGITPFDLADSIIPDFGFVGLFREFVVEGDTFRAYIDNNFKLAYLNEDNRAMKALPKATPTELKDEFKEIGKEIRDIVKSQSSRLEQYLIMQRRWEMPRWEAFFMQNPVLFAYAIRLIWGIYDEKGVLQTVFRVQEDQSLLNREGDEFELDMDDTNLKIGMVHPVHLSSEDIAFWQESQADAEIEPIFPQLARPVLLFDEKHRGVTLCNDFEKIQVNGYTFIGRLEKTGWVRGAIQDAGWIANYYKPFTNLGIVAILEQQGNLCVGYYDDGAEIGSIAFVQSKSVSFGNYTYDLPNKADDPRLIALENIPPIVYSEIMAEMAWWKENETKS